LDRSPAYIASDNIKSRFAEINSVNDCSKRLVAHDGSPYRFESATTGLSWLEKPGRAISLMVTPAARRETIAHVPMLNRKLSMANSEIVVVLTYLSGYSAKAAPGPNAS
jgi:hypothetical protein